MENVISIWPWEYAPSEYKDLSTNGGDEDWVAFVPRRIDERYSIHFLEEYHFGSVVDEFVVDDGRVIISSHA